MYISTSYMVEQFELGEVRRNRTFPTFYKVDSFVPEIYYINIYIDIDKVDSFVPGLQTNIECCLAHWVIL